MGILKGATGKTATIIRSSGNLTIDIYIKPKSRTLLPYMRDFIADSDASPSGELIEGDLVKDGTDYYLIVALSKMEMDVTYAVRGYMYKCNSTVTIKTYNSGTKAYESYATDLPCLITKEHDEGQTDRGVVSPSRRESNKGFFVYAQSDKGIALKSYIIDQDSRKFRVADDINPFFAGGIVEARAVWDNR